MCKYVTQRDDFRRKSRVFDWQNTSLLNHVIFVYEVFVVHEARLAPEIVASGLIWSLSVGRFSRNR